MDNPFIQLTTLKLMGTADTECDLHSADANPHRQCLWSWTLQETKTACTYICNYTLFLLFFLSGDYCLKELTFTENVIPKCNIPIKSLYIFTYFVVLFHSTTLKPIFISFHGNTPYTQVKPALISAVTFQIEMLIGGYYHRKCFPGENYPEH